jgi:DNA-binding CsgD family transcriptional regulator
MNCKISHTFFYIFFLVICACCTTTKEPLNQLYLKLTSTFEDRKFKEANTLADSLIAMAKSEDNYEMELQAKTIKSFCYYRLSIDASQSVKLLEEVMQRPDLMDTYYAPHVYMYLAATYIKSLETRYLHKENHFNVSDSLLDLSMEIFQERGDEGGEFYVLWEKANMYWYNGDIDVSTTYYEKAYQKALAINHPAQPAMIQNLAVVYIIAQRWEESISFIEKIFNSGEIINSPMDAYLYQCLAEAYDNLGQSLNAIDFYKKAINSIKGERGKEVKIWSYEPLAYAYIKMNQFDSAKLWLEEGEAYMLEEEANIEYEYLNLIRAYLSLEKGEYDESRKFGNLYSDAVSKDATPEKRLISQEFQYNLYKQWGKPIEALENLEKYMFLKDSLDQSSYIRRFENYRVRLETAEQRANILELSQEIRDKNTKISMLGIGILLLLVAAYFGINYYRAERRNNKLETLAIRKELELKEQHLADHTLSMLQKNQVIMELDAILKEAKNQHNGELALSLKKIQKTLSISKNMEKNWSQFIEYFGAVHIDFFDKMKEKYPDLSAKQLRHCALIKMNLTMKESAEILGVDANSVKIARYRIRKKMNLEAQENLFDVLSSV